MAEENPRLIGRRYVCLVRCSTNAQEDTSIPDQLKVLHDYANKHGMTHAGGDEDLQLGGISGSNPAARTDIDAVIRRKKMRDDFDVLLVQDLSRLTRGGVEHGGKVEFDLAAAGIIVVFAGSQLPDGDHAGIVKSVEYFSAQQYAKSVSYCVARGQMSAIAEGRQVHCLRPPYAVDRLYVSLDGKPLHVVRNLSNGIQQKLDPLTGAVLQTYAKPIKGQPPTRCRKQAGERIVLIAGAPEYVQVVRRMFRRVLIDGWGDWRIAKELNDLGVPSANGKRWTRQAVKVILRNPVYTGRGIANRRSSARYHERSRNSPRKIQYDLVDMAQQKRPPNRHRPKSEWLEQRHPELESFLGDELRNLAVAYQARFLAEARRPTPIRKDKHVDSMFILKGILRSKQGGCPMSGRTQGPKGKPYRYYHVSRAGAFPSTNRTMRRVVPAGPIERAVLDAIRDTLLHPDVRKRIVGIIRQQTAEMNADAPKVDELRKEQEQLRSQIEFVIDELGQVGRDAARRKMQQLEARLVAVNDRIARTAPQRPMSSEETEKSADEIVERCSEIACSLNQAPAHALRELIASLVVRLEVDLETRAFSMELASPFGVVLKDEQADAPLGVGGNFLRTSSAKAQSGINAILAAFDCEMRGRSCYDCRRRAG